MDICECLGTFPQDRLSNWIAFSLFFFVAAALHGLHFILVFGDRMVLIDPVPQEAAIAAA